MEKSASPPLDRFKMPGFAKRIKRGTGLFTSGKRALENLAGTFKSNGRAKSNRAVASDHGLFQWNTSAGNTGAGASWARTEYGEYYATSVSVYAVIRLRSEALGRPHLKVARQTPEGQKLWVGPSHPAQKLFNRVNPWYTRGDLWRATEIYLSLWGSAFWALEKNLEGDWEIWPLRPDRVSVLPDKTNYIRGFVYRGLNGPVAYTPDEILWLRYFNPMEEYAGHSPLAPARLAVDMGKDGLSFNRNFLRNSARPDFVLLTNESMNDAEIEDFYQRWEARYRGPGNTNRPAIASFVRDIKTLGFSHRDMDFIQGLRWSLEEVSRAYGVPKPLLSDFERATFSNVNAAERLFWRNTMIPEMQFLEEHINRMLLPRLGYPDLTVEFDRSDIEALKEDEAARVSQESQLLDRGVLTIKEVRRSRNLPDVPWGDVWAKAPQQESAKVGLAAASGGGEAGSSNVGIYSLAPAAVNGNGSDSSLGA